jgi:hypothetical protein
LNSARAFLAAVLAASASAAAAVAAATLAPSTAAGQPAGGLKTIDAPGGGQVVYGPIQGETSMPRAMASLLRSVHAHFGDRPQLGKFFQSRGSESVAAFFSLTAKKQDGRQITGLAIVSMRGGAAPSGAVLYDQADRFARSEPQLMARLTEAWQKGGPRQPAREPPAAEPQGPAQPLHTAAVPDGSATIGLPAGWRIIGGGGGSLHAAGPHGEAVHLGVINQNIYDPRNPRAQGMIQYLSKGRTPFDVCPYGDDLVNSFLCVSKQNRARQGQPAPTLRVINRVDLPANQYEVRVEMVSAEMDFHDGKEPVTSNIRMGAMRMGPAGGWALTVSAETVPKHLADEEWPTIKAMVASYRQNGQVIAGQTAQVIAGIHARAAANAKLAEARSAANDAHNAAVDAQWDDQARQNKVFENYTLDRTVIQDNEQNARGAVGYAAADSLVKSDPGRFQYVPNQNLLRGVDY